MRGKVVHCFKSSFIWLQFLQSWVYHFLTQKTGWHHWIPGLEVGKGSVSMTWTHRNALLSSWLCWSVFGKDTEPPPCAHSCWAVKVFPCIQPLTIPAPVLPGRALSVCSRLSTPVNKYTLSLILSSLEHLSATNQRLECPSAFEDLPAWSGY